MKLRKLLPISILALVVGSFIITSCGDDEPPVDKPIIQNDSISNLNKDSIPTTPEDSLPTTPEDSLPTTPEDSLPTTPNDSLIYPRIIASLTGWTNLTTNFINKNYDGDKFILTMAKDGALSVTFINKTWGVATIFGINSDEVVDGKECILQGGIGSFIMNNPRDNSIQEFPCSLQTAIISADRTQMTAVIIANMTTAGAHGEMTFTFQTGDMPTE